MSDFTIVAMILLINLIVILIAENNLFPMAFPAQFVFEPFNFLKMTVGFVIVWYAFQVLRFSRT